MQNRSCLSGFNGTFLKKKSKSEKNTTNFELLLHMKHGYCDVLMLCHVLSEAKILK